MGTKRECPNCGREGRGWQAAGIVWCGACGYTEEWTDEGLVKEVRPGNISPKVVTDGNAA